MSVNDLDLVFFHQVFNTRTGLTDNIILPAKHPRPVQADSIGFNTVFPEILYGVVIMFA